MPALWRGKYSISKNGQFVNRGWKLNTTLDLAHLSEIAMTHDEMRKFISKGEVLAILFRLIRYLGKPVERTVLINNSIKGQIQTIREMSESAYRQLFKRDLGL